MGIRRCSAEEALSELANALWASGVGLGGVSRALLDLVTGDVHPAANTALAHWDAVLGLPARDAPSGSTTPSARKPVTGGRSGG